MTEQRIGIVKRNGQRESEDFSRDKLHSSLRAACLSVRSPEGEAESIAEKVCDKVMLWLERRPEVTSHDLRRKATETLAIFHEDAAYLYQNHRVII